MTCASKIRRWWSTLSRLQKICAAIASIVASLGVICGAIIATVNFLADPPDWARLWLDRHAPGVVDFMHSTVCKFRPGSFAITTGPIASCDIGNLHGLITDSCMSLDLIREKQSNETNSRLNQAHRRTMKNLLMATRVCRRWPIGTGQPFEGPADKVLIALATDMPDCFGVGIDTEGNTTFWLRTESSSVCGARVRMGGNHEWQVVPDLETFFCLEHRLGSSSARELPRNCNTQEIRSLNLPPEAAN